MDTTIKNQYDIVVIGAGSAGLTAAVGFSNIGKSVLLVENQHMGGECTNSGCIPSKSLLHLSKQYHHAVTLSGKTDQTEQFRSTILENVRATIQSILDEEQPEHFQSMGIDVVMSESEFVGPQSILIEGQTITFKKCVIATGSAPRMFDISGLTPEKILTNQNIFELQEIPEKLLIVGAGPIGLEMGQSFAMLGTNVTIVTNETSFLSREEPSVGEIVSKNFEKLGINILTNSTLARVEESRGIVAQDEQKMSIDFDYVLMAVGRVPVFPVGLEKANIAFTKHGITINKNYQTSNKHIYASGDVALRDKFTHTADNASRIIVRNSLMPLGLANLLSGKTKSVPKVTYVSPEIASVGLGSKAAIEKYGEQKLEIITIPYSHNDRAKTDKNTDQGSITVIAKRFSGRIVGASITGPAAGEIISIFTLAMDNKLSMYKLGKLIYPYPTYSLIIKKVTDQYLAQTITRFRK